MTGEGVILSVVLALGAGGCSSALSPSDAGTKAGTGGGQGGAGGAIGVGGAAGEAPGGAGGGAGGRPWVAAPYPANDASTDGPGSATGQFTIVYNGTLTSHLVTCFDCTGFYADPGDGELTLEMENSAGWNYFTRVYVSVQPGVLGAAYDAAVSVQEFNPPFGTMYQGVYSFPSTNPPMNASGGCITFSRLDIAPGGGVAGSIDCDLGGISYTNEGVPAHITGTFSSTFP
jgi:hypothetical protein